MTKLFIDIINIEMLPLQANEYFEINPKPLTYKTLEMLEFNKGRFATSPNDKYPRKVYWDDGSFFIDTEQPQEYKEFAIIVLEKYQKYVTSTTKFRIVTVKDLYLIRRYINQDESFEYSPTTTNYKHWTFKSKIYRRHLKLNPNKLLNSAVNQFATAYKDYRFDTKFHKQNRRLRHHNPFCGDLWSWQKPEQTSWKTKKCRHQWQRHQS